MNMIGDPDNEGDESLVPEDIEATEVFDAYRASVPPGQTPDREPLLADHPALADRLRALIAAERMIAAVAGDVVPEFTKCGRKAPAFRRGDIRAPFLSPLAC